VQAAIARAATTAKEPRRIGLEHLVFFASGASQIRAAENVPAGDDADIFSSMS